MKKIRTWQLCRTGTFGQDGARISEQDLKDIETTFTPPRPISIGHDVARSDNFPKFGDVLAINGIYPDSRHPGEKVLVGQVVLHPELERQFDDKSDGNGVYKGWSVTIPRRASDGKRYLHSLAICGATPPKIPGLEQLMTHSCFGEDKVESIDFSDSIEFEEEIPMTEEEKKKMAALEEENKKLKEDAAKKAEPAKEANFSDSKEYQDMQKEIDFLKSAKKDSEVKALTERFSDRIPASAMPKFKAVANALALGGDCEFADGEKTEKKSALELFSDVLSAVLECSLNKSVTESRFDALDFSDKGEKTDEKNNPADIAARM
ncbi:hypothetical protein [Treponema pectinovorum]|uniref:hypothetical protein n=1 Tax=Treponema pectinovorum TaxID=164 RepID=UPI0011C8B582|nr:hypothetical protein [Treponema pectinovorum]